MNVYCGDVRSKAAQSAAAAGNANAGAGNANAGAGDGNGQYCQIRCDGEACNKVFLGCHGDETSCALVGYGEKSIIDGLVECDAKQCDFVCAARDACTTV